MHTGVCTDVVVRAYRHQQIDLQQLVHNDMKKAWNTYPKRWGNKSTDTNIDHRRVPNLENFFKRHGKSLSLTDVADFKAGISSLGVYRVTCRILVLFPIRRVVMVYH